MSFRVGFGYDIHRLVPNRRLIVGGVHIPYERGLEGHSDGDCLTHAMMDALLGALGLPDIGHFFPNTDPCYQDADSQQLLRTVIQQVTNAGYCVSNIDACLIAEAPKILPYIAAMKAVLASNMGINVSQIGIKATTNEGLGAIGNGEGIAAHAVVLIHKKST